MAATGRTVVVAGAGDVGQRLARMRVAIGDEVLAVRRRPLRDDGPVRWLSADLASGEGLRQLPRRPDAVVFCAAPDQRVEADYRSLFIDGQQRLLEALGGAPARWLLVSSTAVFDEDTGAWVDEATPAWPPAFNGRVLRDAEQWLHAHCPGGGVLRPSGLYGPGRGYLRRRARSGEPPRPHWTNRIHVEDAASALSHLLDLADPEPLYLANDDAPAREDEVLGWLRHRLGLPVPEVLDGPETGRRVSNRLLRSSGWQPRFPDYRSGYGDILDAGGPG